MNDIGRLIAILRKEKKLSQDDLAKRLNCTKQTISNYERGTRRPDYEMLEAISDTLNVPITFFVSKEEQQRELSRIYQTYGSEKMPIPAIPGLIPVRTRRVPVLGEVAAGQPIMAQREYDEYVDIPEDGRQYDFALRVKGDSMEPLYRAGDLVLIRAQDDVDDGQIAAVCLDDEVTLKCLYHIPGGVHLVSENKKYAPMIFTQNDFASIRLVGLAVGYLRWTER